MSETLQEQLSEWRRPFRPVDQIIQSLKNEPLYWERSGNTIQHKKNSTRVFCQVTLSSLKYQPFTVEITSPCRLLTRDEQQDLCDAIKAWDLLVAGVLLPGFPKKDEHDAED